MVNCPVYVNSRVKFEAVSKRFALIDGSIKNTPGSIFCCCDMTTMKVTVL